MGQVKSIVGKEKDSNHFLESKCFKKSQKDFEALGFSDEDILKLYNKVFRRLDLDDSGRVDINELLIFFHIEKTKFTTKIFQVLDGDNSGNIDFAEFA
jgi:Ca2+-binding EF-hand superfamily protein